MLVLSPCMLKCYFHKGHALIINLGPDCVPYICKKRLLTSPKCKMLTLYSLGLIFTQEVSPESEGTDFLCVADILFQNQHCTFGKNLPTVFDQKTAQGECQELCNYRLQSRQYIWSGCHMDIFLC